MKTERKADAPTSNFRMKFSHVAVHSKRTTQPFGRLLLLNQTFQTCSQRLSLKENKTV